MRYISVNCIQPETVLAKPIIGRNGEILLQAGIVLKQAYINSMIKLGIQGAYVNDHISEDLEVVSALSEEIRAKAVKSISATFSKVAGDAPVTKRNIKDIMKTAEQIVDDILSHGDVMLNLFDMKVYDNYTFFHCVNVTVLSIVIGMGLGFSRTRLVNLAYSALLHDIGKMFISREIINKKGSLTDEEAKIVQKHPYDGYEYLKEHFGSSVPKVVLAGVLQHHERFDGTGYPSGLRGKNISEFARIISVTDIYDALTSDRPYRKGIFPVEAMEYVQGGCGTIFDIDIVNVFSRKVALFPAGMMVMLSDGSIALVMENFEGFTQRPKVKVVENKGVQVSPFLIDLHEEAFDITVVAIIDM